MTLTGTKQGTGHCWAIVYVKCQQQQWWLLDVTFHMREIGLKSMKEISPYSEMWKLRLQEAHWAQGPTLVKKRGRTWMDSQTTLSPSSHSQWLSSSQTARFSSRTIFDSSLSHSLHQPVTNFPPLLSFTNTLQVPPSHAHSGSPDVRLVRDPWRAPPCVFNINTTSWRTVLISSPCSKTSTAY